MDGWIDGWIDGWGWMDVWMWMDRKLFLATKRPYSRRWRYQYGYLTLAIWQEPSRPAIAIILCQTQMGSPESKRNNIIYRRTWSHTIRTHSTPMCKIGWVVWSLFGPVLSGYQLLDKTIFKCFFFKNSWWRICIEKKKKSRYNTIWWHILFFLSFF
jgi:hypothetical protein